MGGDRYIKGSNYRCPLVEVYRPLAPYSILFKEYK
jgi:hypothetical protein